MAIKDIQIKSHDIYLERNGDKGGNLNIGASTTTNSLTVNTTTNNKGGLIVGTSDSPSYLDVYGVINNNGNLTVSGTITGNTLAVGTGGLTVSASTTTNSLTVNTNTINKGNLTVGTSTTQGNIDVYGDLLLSGNHGGSISSYNGLTVSAPYITFTTSPNYITFNTPTMVMNTNKISIKRENINIDDFVTYTPSTIPEGENKSWRYRKECDLDSVCTTDKKSFKYIKKTEKLEMRPGIYMDHDYYVYTLTISDSLSSTELSDLQKYKNQATLKLIVKFSGETTFTEITLSSSTVDLNRKTLIITANDANMSSTTTEASRFNNIRASGKTIDAVTFMAIGGAILGEDAILSIDQYSTIQINENKHVLLNCASTGTTNISYFPNTEYNKEQEKLVVVTANSVSLNPGDFIEFYLIGDSCYICCSALNMEGVSNALGISRGSPGYIYYEPTGTKAYIYSYNDNPGNDSLNEKQVISTIGTTLLIKFSSSSNSNAGAPSEVIIKK